MQLKYLQGFFIGEPSLLSQFAHYSCCFFIFHFSFYSKFFSFSFIDFSSSLLFNFFCFIFIFLQLSVFLYHGMIFLFFFFILTFQFICFILSLVAPLPLHFLQLCFILAVLSPLLPPYVASLFSSSSSSVSTPSLFLLSAFLSIPLLLIHVFLNQPQCTSLHKHFSSS